MTSIHLATEDELSETVARKLVEELSPVLEVGMYFRRNGFGYLKTSVRKFSEIARRTPVFLLTDLDTGICPAALISGWLGDQKTPETLVFRVAVREVESWLLADQEGMKRLLGRGAAKLPMNPDEEADPKRRLLSLADRAPRDVREDLLPEKGAANLQGLGYNRRLCAFVREVWEPARAEERSDSLRRTRERLQQLAERVKSSKIRKADQ